MNKPELLSPAGNPACALAAFDAGADAVYAGLSKFNARERGENFTADNMAGIISYAHARGRKVYLTLNTLIREAELSEVMETLELADSLAPDAVLVQDLGVLRLMRRYYPQLAVHASTQMGIHNSAGLNLLAELGVRRVVLERQVTMEELRSICGKTALELEVFIHGALCCSLSGSCLFSSFGGGWSGNRGKCKQPCRRRYFSKQGNGFFFSPQDLETLELLPQFRELGIASLKIEGRLKQPDYVLSTVGAYRMLLDAETPEDFAAKLPEARNLLSRACGRKWSSGFYSAESSKTLIQSSAIGAFGLRVGTVEAVRDNGFGFTAAKRVHLGDRLRVQPKSGEDGEALTLTKIFVNNLPARHASAGQRVFVCCDKPMPLDGAIFKIGESFPDYSARVAALPAPKTGVELKIRLSAGELAVSVLNGVVPDWRMPLTLAPAAKHPAAPERLLASFAECDSPVLALAPSSTAEIEGEWFFPASEMKRCRREFWEYFRSQVRPEQLVSLRRSRLDDFLTDYRARRPWIAPEEKLPETVALKPEGAEPADRRAVRANSVFELNRFSAEAILPDFTPEFELPALRRALLKALDAGITRFRVTAIAGLALLRECAAGREITITISAPLPVCNSEAAALLAELGAGKVMAHLELPREDILALAAHSELPVECYRYGRPPLLSTRAAIPFAGEFTDNRGNHFELRRDGHGTLSRIYPKPVVSVPRLPGIYDFYDLRNANWRAAATTEFNFESVWP